MSVCAKFHLPLTQVFCLHTPPTAFIAFYHLFRIGLRFPCVVVIRFILEQLPDCQCVQYNPSAAPSYVIDICCLWDDLLMSSGRECTVVERMVGKLAEMPYDDYEGQCVPDVSAARYWISICQHGIALESRTMAPSPTSEIAIGLHT
ncbi:hypothetical protein PAXRUDRAFT_227613 [Paxillus rubicundulus Ve08.2h10]|uniref:Uncharacterized protein n=1 Tax=Paxillus rubicundulus Ve08.2h10 TaxID=930991 RepID=A0A0D0DTT7_9AGAM|nr:hypothetical protein PAXRUDRAFT_227613 [Paxillus rubicundulus Ve08.2h10]